ncbi:MAG: hypothetical protein ACREQ4_14820, partial [Candidatus Binataceae bacterium]
MRKSSLALMALCGTLLWAWAVYAQSAKGSARAQDDQSGKVSGESLFGQFANRCPPFFKPQRFPATGQTTSYVAGDDGAIRAGAPLRYRDNGDGTITDENTKLMWEKKDQASGGLHNWDNTYPWEGTCSNSSTTLCGTDADCSRDGTCIVAGGGITIFQWVAQL